MLSTTPPARRGSLVSPTLSIKISSSLFQPPHISRVHSTSYPEARLSAQALRSGVQQGLVDTINLLTTWRAHSTSTPSLLILIPGTWAHRSLHPHILSIPRVPASISLFPCSLPPRPAPIPPPPQHPNPSRKCTTAVRVGMSRSGLTRSLILPPILADRQCG